MFIMDKERSMFSLSFVDITTSWSLHINKGTNMVGGNNSCSPHQPYDMLYLFSEDGLEGKKSMKDMHDVIQVELTDEELQQVAGGYTGGGWANANGTSYSSSGYGASAFNNGAVSNNYSSGGGNAGYYGGDGGFAAATGQASSFGAAATGPFGFGITTSGGNASDGAWSLGW